MKSKLDIIFILKWFIGEKFGHLTLETTGGRFYQVESLINILDDLPDRIMIREFEHSDYRDHSDGGKFFYIRL